jgi:hypothetical protein
MSSGAEVGERDFATHALYESGGSKSRMMKG